MTSREDCREIYALRRRVFVDEQGMPESMAWDPADDMAYYALVFDEQGAPSGTGRLILRDDQFRIGRVCVLEAARGQHLGDLIMRMLLVRAQEMNAPSVELSAQAHMMPFYARYGFRPAGEPYEAHGKTWQLMRVAADQIDIDGKCGGHA